MVIFNDKTSDNQEGDVCKKILEKKATVKSKDDQQDGDTKSQGHVGLENMEKLVLKGDKRFDPNDKEENSIVKRGKLDKKKVVG